ncbi:dipeptidase [Helcobacillus massiliensis]|uniref:dipeptidase n=1 Tax=Helcobacillus massiliensis TaxID=521392 RepID=UPI0021A97127|nr:dipeptidase [Helcobacillus massiliensis]MCT1556900.1 dipeptidase [Helcobacillus massiliensis]MCT2035289.1 dipeptidase [Helcobacillus massiliensis]MCT2331496.1 dipeptidase [Helcobacillus massiliensis]
MTVTADPKLTARIAELMPEAVEDLKSLVRIPSIAFDGYDQSHVARSAEAVADLLREAGMPEVEIDSVDGGAPAVLARRPAADGMPTVMLYAHHDVQPVGDENAWTSAPFEPEERDGRLYGRGAADDKAGIMAHVTALRALREELDESGVGVTVFIEGEEEWGSPTFRPFIEKHRDAMRSDIIIVADSSNWKIGQPSLTTSLRGLVDAVIDVRVLDFPVHSGMFGGPILDAPTQLGRLIATFHDADGAVAIKGLHQAEEPDVDMDEADLRRDAGVPDGLGLSGTGSLTGRLWTKPALSIIGIDATPVQQASNTIIASTRAKVSLRLAPGQEPEAAMEALIQHVKENTPNGAEVTVTPGEMGKPFLAPANSAGMKLARAAFEASWGVKPVDTGLGGSIPFIADLLEVFPEADVLVTGVEDPDSRAHGIDESLHLGDFEHVCLAEAHILRGAAAGGGR